MIPANKIGAGLLGLFLVVACVCCGEWRAALAMLAATLWYEVG